MPEFNEDGSYTVLFRTDGNETLRGCPLSDFPERRGQPQYGELRLTGVSADLMKQYKDTDDGLEAEAIRGILADRLEEYGDSEADNQELVADFIRMVRIRQGLIAAP